MDASQETICAKCDHLEVCKIKDNVQGYILEVSQILVPGAMRVDFHCRYRTERRPHIKQSPGFFVKE